MNKRHSNRPVTGKQDIKPSQASYNFVPLNTKVIKAPAPLPEFDKYHDKRHTGYIDLEIKALTPLYIRDTLNDTTFFSPGELYRIPGSSLRGMIRTLMEIVSWAKFEFFDDSRLYFRFMADRKRELREYYRKRLGKPKAGLLKKKGFKKYVIIPADYEIRKDTSKAEEIIPVNGGWIVYTGSMQGKKRNYFIKIPKPDAKEIPVDYERVIKSYTEDKNRKSKIDLIEWLEKKEEFRKGIPCFYSQDEKGDIMGIGHTPNFRIPYENTIGACVRQSRIDGFDLVEAIFGNQSTHAGRVFFEDAIAEGKVETYEEAYPKILSTPKPTCIQHYIAQDSNELKHYDSHRALIRGYKLYWHRDPHDWQQTDKKEIEEHPTQYTKIQPVKEGTVFKGRIRFENLTEIELGALLFVLKLPEGLAHKIGMAKPLGLGSIKITPKLYLSDRKKRYTELFSEWKGLPEADENTVKKFIKAFEDFILKEIGKSKEIKSLWETDRLRALKVMLDWNNKPSNKDTEYLSLEEFKNRPILPAPEEVIKRL